MKRKKVDPQQRRTETREFSKDYLLQILQHEGLLPADATRIIATGHRQDTLTVTVTFD